MDSLKEKPCANSLLPAKIENIELIGDVCNEKFDHPNADALQAMYKLDMVFLSKYL